MLHIHIHNAYYMVALVYYNLDLIYESVIKTPSSMRM